ncbi:MAG: hypothetical protein ACNA7J_13530 [Wenzhouxiangella sp.]
MARIDQQRMMRRALPAGVGLAYGLFYLYAIGDMTLYGPPAWGAFLTDPTLERIFSARSTLMFEAIAVIELGWLVWLVSPLNILIAGLLAGLLAANIHGVLYIRANPATCRVRSSNSLAGAFPALFAGGACCAPSLILLLGIPGLGAVSAFFGWLVPISIVALGLSRVWQHHHGAPPMFTILPRRREISTSDGF